MRRAALILALVALSCGTEATIPGPSTSSGPASTPTTTVPPPIQPVAFEPSDCGAPPTDFALICQAFDLIVSHHVDTPDPAALAAAATLGVSSAPTGSETSPLSAIPSTCPVPDPSFISVCEAIADRLNNGLPLPTLVEAAVEGMFGFGLDPFSSYVPPDLVERLGSLGPGLVLDLGIIVGGRDPNGIACAPLGPGCSLVVLSVFEFTPAEEAGMVAGDVILRIDGVELDRKGPDQAAALLGGHPGSTVEVTIDRGEQIITKRMVREDVRFEPLEADVVAGDIVHLRLNEFSETSAQLLGQALGLEDMQRARALILDVRDNPGGLVAAAQAIASQFLDDGVVLVERRRHETIEWPVLAGGLAPDLRMVLLTNRGTASAAEMLAAALQEHERAVIIGQPTFGKNLIQDTFRARDGGEFRISVARWTTTEGFDVGVTGVLPDVEVITQPDAGGDPILEQAIDYLGG